MTVRSAMLRVQREVEDIRLYFLGPPARAEDNDGREGGRPTYVSTGEPLIEELVQAIKLHQPALATGPRGCGKSYCAMKAVRRALKEGIVGEFRYIQGNSQLPRDYLMEDMLVARDDKSLELLTALIFRSVRGANAKGETERKLLERFPLWPAFPTREVTDSEDPRTYWKPCDWTVYFFDELNRFSDGFLDSLLSVMEEKIAVRRGEAFYVPATVIATANPPGYDLTAKKLSPPLQARLARSYLMVQPDLEDLVGIILADRLKNEPLLNSINIPMELQYRAAGATLCLWGSVEDSNRTGLAYLTPETCDLLRTAESRSLQLRRGMRTLGELSNFGPDARAIGDWIVSAAMKAKERQSLDLTSRDLISVAQAVLPHKIREIFNEGVEPQKGVALRAAVMDVVVSVFANDLADLFEILFAVARKFGLDQRVLDERLGNLQEGRRNSWRLGLTALSKLVDASQGDTVRKNLVSYGALSSEGSFLSEAELDWCYDILRLFRISEIVMQSITAWSLDANQVLKSHKFAKASTAEIASEIQRQFDSDDSRPAILKHGAIRECIFTVLDNVVDQNSTAVPLFMQSLDQAALRWRIKDTDYVEALRDGRRWLIELQRFLDTKVNLESQINQMEDKIKENQ